MARILTATNSCPCGGSPPWRGAGVGHQRLPLYRQPSLTSSPHDLQDCTHAMHLRPACPKGPYNSHALAASVPYRPVCLPFAYSQHALHDHTPAMHLRSLQRGLSNPVCMRAQVRGRLRDGGPAEEQHLGPVQQDWLQHACCARAPGRGGPGAGWTHMHTHIHTHLLGFRIKGSGLRFK